MRGGRADQYICRKRFRMTRTDGRGLYRIDLVTTRVLGVSKKLAFTKERRGNGNFDGMVSE